MAIADLPLHDLAQRLAQKQAELEEARQAYEDRLGDLSRRQDELHAQLRAVDTEIQAVGATAVPTATTAPAPPAVPPSQAPRQSGKAVPEVKNAAPSNKAAATTANTATPVAQTGSVSLRELLTRLLTESKRPLKAKELAEQALAAGYQTTSKDFVKVIWVALGKLDNLERMPGQGYRLKKATAKRK